MLGGIRVDRLDIMSMATTETMKRWIRVAPFVFTLICFYLPFISLSDRAYDYPTLTGLQLPFGGDVDVSDNGFKHYSAWRQFYSEPAILWVFSCAATATAFCFFAGKPGRLFPAILGVLGFILMLVVKRDIDNNLIMESHDDLTVDYRIGFILVCILLLVGVVVCVYQYISSRISQPVAYDAA